MEGYLKTEEMHGGWTYHMWTDSPLTEKSAWYSGHIFSQDSSLRPEATQEHTYPHKPVTRKSNSDGTFAQRAQSCKISKQIRQAVTACRDCPPSEWSDPGLLQAGRGTTPQRQSGNHINKPRSAVYAEMRTEEHEGKKSLHRQRSHHTM